MTWFKKLNKPAFWAFVPGTVLALAYMGICRSKWRPRVIPADPAVLDAVAPDLVWHPAAPPGSYIHLKDVVRRLVPVLEREKKANLPYRTMTLAEARDFKAILYPAADVAAGLTSKLKGRWLGPVSFKLPKAYSELLATYESPLMQMYMGIAPGINCAAALGDRKRFKTYADALIELFAASQRIDDCGVHVARGRVAGINALNRLGKLLDSKAWDKSLLLYVCTTLSKVPTDPTQISHAAKFDYTYFLLPFAKAATLDRVKARAIEEMSFEISDSEDHDRIEERRRALASVSGEYDALQSVQAEATIIREYMASEGSSFVASQRPVADRFFALQNNLGSRLGGGEGWDMWVGRWKLSNQPNSLGIIFMDCMIGGEGDYSVQQQASESIVKCAFLLKAYEIKFGHLPRALSELNVLHLPMPSLIDPFNGKELHYDPQLRMLYSVNYDRVDDKGAMNGSLTHGRDYGITIP